MAGVSVGSLYQYFPSKEASWWPSSIATIGRSCRWSARAGGGRLAADSESGAPACGGRHRGASHRTETASRAGRTDSAHGSLENWKPSIARPLRCFEASWRAIAGDSCADLGLAAFVCATSIEALAHNAVLRSEVSRTNRWVRFRRGYTSRGRLSTVAAHDSRAAFQQRQGTKARKACQSARNPRCSGNALTRSVPRWLITAPLSAVAISPPVRATALLKPDAMPT